MATSATPTFRATDVMGSLLHRPSAGSAPCPPYLRSFFAVNQKVGWQGVHVRRPRWAVLVASADLGMSEVACADSDLQAGEHAALGPHEDWPHHEILRNGPVTPEGT